MGSEKSRRYPAVSGGSVPFPDSEHAWTLEQLVNSMARLYWKRNYKKASRKFGIKLRSFVNKSQSCSLCPYRKILSFKPELSLSTSCQLLQLHPALPVPSGHLGEIPPSKGSLFAKGGTFPLLTASSCLTVFSPSQDFQGRCHLPSPRTTPPEPQRSSQDEANW